MTNIDLFKTEEGREQLAREFVILLENDKTEPVPNNDSWLGEKKFRDLEQPSFLPRLFREYEDLCEKAEKMTSEPTVRALFQINRINGLRRLPEGERDDDLIRRLFEEVDGSLQNLEDSPRKNRLLQLRHYHAGTFFRVIGDYLSAAESLDHSAELAETSGNIKAAVISRFIAAFERVKHALVNEPESLKAELTKELSAGKTFYETLDTEHDIDSTRFKLFSGPNQLILSHFWANEQYDSQADRKRLNQLESVNPEFFSQRESDISATLAAEAWIRGNLEQARQLAEKVINRIFGKFNYPEFIATANLLLGRIAAAEGRKEEAKQHFQDTIVVQGSVHQVRAIAERELNGLN